MNQIQSYKERQKSKGPVIIQKPLRFIRDELGTNHDLYKHARIQAKFGNGQAVRQIAAWVYSKTLN